MLLETATPAAAPQFSPLWPLLFGLATLIVQQLFALLQARANGRRGKENGEKVDALLVKSEEIHKATNGTLGEMRQEVRAARKEAEIANERTLGLEKALAAMAMGSDKAATIAKDAIDAGALREADNLAKTPPSP